MHAKISAGIGFFFLHFGDCKPVTQQCTELRFLKFYKELSPWQGILNSRRLNPLVPDRTLKYVFSKNSFRYFFSHNISISYPILKI